MQPKSGRGRSGSTFYRRLSGLLRSQTKRPRKAFLQRKFNLLSLWKTFQNGTNLPTPRSQNPCMDNCSGSMDLLEDMARLNLSQLNLVVGPLEVPKQYTFFQPSQNHLAIQTSLSLSFHDFCTNDLLIVTQHFANSFHWKICTAFYLPSLAFVLFSIGPVHLDLTRHFLSFPIDFDIPKSQNKRHHQKCLSQNFYNSLQRRYSPSISMI